MSERRRKRKTKEKEIRRAINEAMKHFHGFARKARTPKVHYAKE